MTQNLPINVRIDAEQIWHQVFESAKRFSSPSPALFLDRDGVVVEEVHYLRRAEDVALIDGAATVIASANQANIPVVIVTNQSGIARGMFDWQAFNDVQQQMLALLTKAGAFVDAVYACPHHKSGQAPFDHRNHSCRKPNPGMLLQAFQDIPTINPKGSWIVGDKAADLEAGKKAGLLQGAHVLTGHGSDEGEADKAIALGDTSFAVRPVESISALTDLF